MAQEKYKAKWHKLLLYTDNEEHMSAIETIKNDYTHLMILHDKDVWTEKDVGHVRGELKKPHYHVLMKFVGDTYNTSIAERLVIDKRFIMQVPDPSKFMRYLIHKGNDDKYQYPVDDVSGDTVLFEKYLESITTKAEKNECAISLINYMKTQLQENALFSPTDLLEFALENDMADSLRRFAPFYLWHFNQRKGVQFNDLRVHKEEITYDNRTDEHLPENSL